MSGDDIVTAALLVIGDEILSGRTCDQNINYIAAHCTCVGIRMREQWRSLGGEALWLAPCLNGDMRFAEAVAGWIRRRAPAPRP